MARKRFTEREVIETLIRTGHEIRCFKTKEAITLENVGRIEREHPIPLALGGKDDPTNAAYSLMEAHKIQTNGKPATSYGSDKHAIAKVARLKNPKPSKRPMQSSGRPIPSRPMQSAPFPQRKQPWPKRRMRGPT